MQRRGWIKTLQALTLGACLAASGAAMSRTDPLARPAMRMRL